jgi:NAD(P)-dependent dehydrogenase (short-subunit alcohol dehydrogenase family)
MKKHRTALITGASKGLGFQLAKSLARSGWKLLITARHAQALLNARKQLASYTEVTAIAGDVRDEIHLMEVAEALELQDWKLDLVVNNASDLGVSPLSSLLDHPVESLHRVFHANMIAPISLLQKVRTYLQPEAQVINISSDAAVEAYASWGAYGGSKAGLDHMTSVLSLENPLFTFYAFDPGDMRTDMHQAAFPGEDISDRPLPEEVAVPALIQLIESGLPSGRYNSESFKKEMA